VIELFQTYEVFLQLSDMLLLDSNFFSCIEAVFGFLTALEHTAIRSLSKFFQELVFLKKSIVVVSLLCILRKPYKIGVTFGGIFIG